jgi:hypothetical protein
MVVAKKGSRYVLLDGERRYHASKEAGLTTVPAYVLRGASGQDLTKSDQLFRMFQIHHLREPWGPIQQCEALEKTFQRIERRTDTDHIQDERQRFTAVVRQLAALTGIDTRTAADRVKFLRWPAEVKQELYHAPNDDEKAGAYSYILEIEDKIILPALANYPEYFQTVPVNSVRRDLLRKLDEGLRHAKEVREIAPFFRVSMPRQSDRKRLLAVLTELRKSPEMSYQEAFQDLSRAFPEVVKGEAPSPRRLVTMCNELENAVTLFDPTLVERARRRAKATRQELREGLASLQRALSELHEALGEDVE